MHKLSIADNTRTINFSIGQKKYLVGNNFELKYEIIRAMRKQFYSIEPSEYASESGLISCIKIDDKPLDMKRWRYYEIHSRFDVDTDLKLGAKAIMLKYLESLLINIEYDPLIQTLNNLLKDLESLIDDLIEHQLEPYSLKSQFPEITIKTIIKLIELGVFKDDLKINMYDMSIIDSLKFQLLTVMKIAEMNLQNEYLICLESLWISKELLDIIESNKFPNLHILVFTEDKIKTDISNVVNFSKRIIDFANEVDLYNDIVLEADFQMSMDLLREYLSAYIQKDEIFGQKITKYL